MGQPSSPCSESCLLFMFRNLNSSTQKNSICFLGGNCCCVWAASGIFVTVICFWTDTALLQKRHQCTGTPFTGSELYTLIKNPPDSKHLFFLRSMIDLICSWKEKGFKNLLQLSSLPNWEWNKIISAFCQPETCNEVSGYETLTPCPSSPLANLPVHSMSFTFANHSFHFQVSFWSFLMHRILFCLFILSTKPKTKIWMYDNLEKPCYRPKEQPHGLHS